MLQEIVSYALYDCFVLFSLHYYFALSSLDGMVKMMMVVVVYYLVLMSGILQFIYC